jgi:hypothetical protein
VYDCVNVSFKYVVMKKFAWNWPWYQTTPLAGREAEQDKKDRADLPAAEAFAGPVARAGDSLIRGLEASE